jgi:hypothetical protein
MTMTEVFVFKVGPFALARGPVSMYFAIGGDIGPIPSTDDLEALQAIARQLPEHQIVCEPRLLDAARALGLGVAPFSRKMAYRCAIASLEIFAAPVFEEIENIDFTDAFCDAAHRFAFARVANVLPSNAAFRIKIEGAVCATYESMLQAEDSGAHGFVLYEEPGLVHTLRSKDAELPRVVDSLGLFLLQEPQHILAAMHRAYGLEWIPRPTSIKGRKPANLTETGLLVLAGAATAFADMVTRQRSDGDSVAVVEDCRVHVAIQPLGD